MKEETNKTKQHHKKKDDLEDSNCEKGKVWIKNKKIKRKKKHRKSFTFFIILFFSYHPTPKQKNKLRKLWKYKSYYS
jgi:hypothetical protein